MFKILIGMCDAFLWRRMSKEEHFVDRGGQVDDELGSGLVEAWLVRADT